MTAGIAAESTLLADSAARFVAERYGPDAWRDLADSPAGFSRGNWRSMADLGWLGVGLPEACGGLDCGPAERLAIMEAIGRGLVLEPYLSTAVVAAELILAAGTPGQKARWLPGIASGETVFAFAQHEPGSHFESAATACSARRTGGGHVLDGDKIAVLDAPGADLLIVLARSSGEPPEAGGCSLFVVDAGAPGVHRRAYPAVDGRRCADIRFDRVALDADRLLGAEGTALAAVGTATSHAIVALCAEAVGAMSALLAMTVEHLKTRVQFGRPLAEFQVLRHRAADMYVACEEARSMVGLAAASLQAAPGERDRNCSAAKACIGRAARFVGQQAVQLHGGIGMTDDLRVGHYFKRLMAIDALFGNTHFHLRRFMRGTNTAH